MSLCLPIVVERKIIHFSKFFILLASSQNFPTRVFQSRYVQCALYHGAGSNCRFLLGTKKSEILRICSFCAAAPEFSHLYFKVQKELSHLHNSSVDTVVCPSVPSSVILILLTMIKQKKLFLLFISTHNNGLTVAFENLKGLLLKIVVD